jgi:hypothetical protein
MSAKIQASERKRGYLEELEHLRSENLRLRAEVDFLRGNPEIARGIRGETLIAELLGAKKASPGAPYDVVTARNRVRLEIKYSSLLNVGRTHLTRRWVWTKIFGEQGRKEYHRLLLVGDRDFQFSCQYADPDSPYVFFDLSYKTVVGLVGGVRPGRSGRIDLTTNPIVTKSWRARTLFNDHQVSLKELKNRYLFKPGHEHR